MTNQDGIYPSYYGEISLVPRLSLTMEMHGRAINKLMRILMSFIISVCLLIVTLSMPYIQLLILHDKRIKAIIILGYVRSLT